jgi:hypothetical protein
MTVSVRLLSGGRLRSASEIGGGAAGGFGLTMVRGCLVQRLKRDVAKVLDKMTVGRAIVSHSIRTTSAVRYVLDSEASAEICSRQTFVRFPGHRSFDSVAVTMANIFLSGVCFVHLWFPLNRWQILHTPC